MTSQIYNTLYSDLSEGFPLEVQNVCKKMYWGGEAEVAPPNLVCRL